MYQASLISVAEFNSLCHYGVCSFQVWISQLLEECFFSSSVFIISSHKVIISGKAHIYIISNTL